MSPVAMPGSGAKLRSLADIADDQQKANDLLSASTFTRYVKCTLCTVTVESEDSNPMLWMHELRRAGWLALDDVVFCPDCNLL